MQLAVRYQVITKSMAIMVLVAVCMGHRVASVSLSMAVFGAILFQGYAD